MTPAEKKDYKRLQKHLDKMPVGFPATRSGVELRILKSLFTPEQARIAACLTHRFEPAEAICQRAAEKGLAGSEDCRAALDEMARKGGIFKKKVNGLWHYALVPFVIGMFEFQLNRLTRQLYEDTARYFREGFALSYLSTPRPQMRVIPVEQSIDETQHIATYDEIRKIIEDAGDRIGVAECICRKGKDLADDPCRATDRRELCFGFRDYFDTYHREGWLRKVDKAEALEILARSEAEGLVLQATNEQHPQAICACCGCCCGILGTLQNVPNRADFAAGNYRAQIDETACVGCGLCADRCHMDAILLRDKKAVVESKKCIGCGVCVPACNTGALTLMPKPEPVVPPETTEDLYAAIEAETKPWDKVKTAFNILRHMKISDIRALIR